MNKKFIGLLERLIQKLIIGFIHGRKIPFIGVIFYFILKLLGIEIPIGVKIGKKLNLVHWANGLVIHPSTIIEDNVKIYQGVTLGRGDIYKSAKDSKMEGILIKEGAVICAGAKILCKEGILIIGKNTVIGANSVITSSTGDNEIWAGIPAKKIKNIHN